MTLPQADIPPPFRRLESLYPERSHRLRRISLLAVIIGISAAVVQHGLVRITETVHMELGVMVIVAMAVVVIANAVRLQWSLERSTFLNANRGLAALCAVWLAGIVAVLIFGPFLEEWRGIPTTRFTAMIAISETVVVLLGMLGVVSFTRRASADGWNPGVILVFTFVGLILLGTTLLMMPRARAETAPVNESVADRLRIALFTSTSASCVTGLIVVPTGGSQAYWSETGQTVILGLFQLGGLGIMTWGAFFTLAAGRGIQMRETATLGEMLESEHLVDVRRLLAAILIFTIVAELIGAFLLSGLWADKPPGERAFYSLFHSVSAFCNAGFSLTENSFVAWGGRWQIWGVASALIITGGMGFAVLHNVTMAIVSRFKRLKRPPLFSSSSSQVRLSLTSRLVIGVTVGLLLTGAVGYYLLEAAGPSAQENSSKRLADAWFQSVTFRTAGFNSVDHGDLQPATKLFAIILMFIGASPGSTGGGVKTICFVLAVLAVGSILRGRDRVEIFGRTIPTTLVNRALAIIALGTFMVMISTLLLVWFENQPQMFLDHLFEATSAFGTVGVSTGITGKLSDSSQFVIMATMFLGRVGPLTLLIALAGRKADAVYEYPQERVTLG